MIRGAREPFGGFRRNDLPAIGSDFDRAPTLIGKIKIEPADMLSDAGMDYLLAAIKPARASAAQSLTIPQT